MKLPHRWTKNALLFGGIAAWGLLLISCVSVNRAVLAPPRVAGATFVGTKTCAECHADITDHFKTATHANLALSDAKVGDTGCEACHGPGSVHNKAGGGGGTIVNPGKSPETCFACHLDKRGEFSLPNAHPVLAGKIGLPRPAPGQGHQAHRRRARNPQRDLHEVPHLPEGSFPLPAPGHAGRLHRLP